MADINASLGGIRTTKNVNLEGFGEFTLRQMGSNEELNLSIKRRRLNRIIEKTQEIIDEMEKIGKDDKDREDQLIAQADKLGDEAIEIRKYIDKVFKGCFTDASGGKKIHAFIDTLTEFERGKLLELFNQDLVAVESAPLSEENHGSK